MEVSRPSKREQLSQGCVKPFVRTANFDLLHSVDFVSHNWGKMVNFKWTHQESQLTNQPSRFQEATGQI